MIEANPQLHREIVELYQAHDDILAEHLLETLNSPARVSQRGFVVEAQQLIAIIIDTWRIKDTSMFVLYNTDQRALATTEVFYEQFDACNAAELYGSDVIVKRLDLC